MPHPDRYQNHDVDHHHPDSPYSPKRKPKILSILIKAIIMTLITSLFFLLLGFTALILLPVLFTSLHRHHNRHHRADLSDGLSPKDLKRVPQLQLSKRIESPLGAESECVACLEWFKQGQWCRVLVGCGHVFHRKCVDTWLVKVAACPTCRTTVCLILEFEVDFILLAGYLKLIPVEMVRAYLRSMVNIHPSLLPAFGCKGYYGMKVHKVVIASGARYCGPTIHFVDEHYDTGRILAQRDTAEDLAARVLKEVVGCIS